MQYTKFNAINHTFASTYGEGIYGSNEYSASSSSTGGGDTTGTGTGTAPAANTSQGSLLTNTGFDVLAAATLACAIIFAALLVRFWKRPAKSASGATDAG